LSYKNIKNNNHISDTICYNESVDNKSTMLFEIDETCNSDDYFVPFEDLKWLTTKEAAKYLRVSVSSIKMMVYRGTIRVRKLGRRNRFLREELDRVIKFPSNLKEV